VANDLNLRKGKMTMSFFEWDAQCDVGEFSIDSDHRMFARSINELHDAVQSKRGNEVLKSILSDVVRLLTDHFVREEELMKKHQYPEYGDHKMEHELFAERLRGLQREVEAGTGLPTVETLSSFADWFQHHTKGTDTRLAAYVSKAGDRQDTASDQM